MPGSNGIGMKRGRGRPRKTEHYDGGYGQQKLDPTGEMFLRTETRTGGPTDPFHSFEDNCSKLFADKFSNPNEHPLHEFLVTYSFARTP